MPSIEYFFKEQLVTKPGMKIREPQITMALAVDEAFRNKQVFTSEAEVGTGKSFAYLVPGINYAITTHKPLIVSTNTMILQDQLADKDVCDLSAYLIEFGYLTNPISAYVAKGIKNYFCPKRFNELLENEIDNWLQKEIKAAAAEASTSKLYNLSQIGLNNNLFGSADLAQFLWDSFSFFRDDIHAMLNDGFTKHLYSGNFLQKYIPYEFGEYSTLLNFDFIWETVNGELADANKLARLLVEGLESGSYIPALKNMIVKGLGAGVFTTGQLMPLMLKVISSEYSDEKISDLTQDLFIVKQTYQEKLGYCRNDFTVNDALWHKLCVRQCHPKCSESGCLFKHHKNRRSRTDSYDVMICNHHYLLSLLRDPHFNLYNYCGIVIDEAHNLETTAYSIFGAEYSKSAYWKIINNVYGQIKGKSDNANELRATCINSLNKLFNVIEDKTIFPPDLDPQSRLKIEITHNLRTSALGLWSSLEALNDAYQLTRAGVKKEYLDTTESIMNGLEEALSIICYDDKHYLFWVEIDKNEQLILKAIPHEVNRLLHKNLFKPDLPIILTSATLSTDTTAYGFDYFEFCTGIANLNSRYYRTPVSLKSPFDYSNQAAIYIDQKYRYINRRDPTYPEYLANTANRIYEIIKLTKGRALVLFTSYEAMDITWKQISENIRKNLGINCYKQGDTYSRNAILNRFSDDIAGCLFATGSFWEGIDIKGPSLSCVIIHKLPFPVMDPVLEYKLSEMEEFFGQDVRLLEKEMVLRLKQGAGRLIRDESDKGILVIMDTRATNRYESLVFNNLPAFKRLHDLDELSRFIELLG